MDIRRGSFLLVVIAALGAFPSLAAGAEKRSRSVLEDVAALDKLVTYTEAKVPLSELVQRVAEDTGANLTTHADVADEPVAVVVKDFPARDLLEQLADLLDYHWSRRGKEGAWRYEIWQDLASKQREEALRQAVTADVERRFQEEVTRFVQVASLPPEKIAEHAKEWSELPGRERQALLRSTEGRARLDRDRVATMVARPVDRALAGLLGRLSPQQWTALKADQPLIFASKPQPGELALPEEPADVFRAWGPTLFPDRWTDIAGYRVTIWFDVRRFRRSGALFLQANAGAIRSSDPKQPSLDSATGNRLHLGALQIVIPPISYDTAQTQEQTPERRAALEKDPVLGATKLFNREAKRHPESWRLPGYEDPTLRDLLPDLARTFGVHFISDAYSNSPGLSFPGSPAERTALFVWLDANVSSSHRWDRVGNLIRLRSRTWYLDRPKEIPLRHIRRWKQLYERHAALPLDTYLEMVTTLSDLQVQSLGSVGREMRLPEELPFSEESAAQSALLLYASLSPAQRQALWQGAALPAAQMTARQRRLFLALLKEFNPNSFILIDAGQRAIGSFSLAREHYTRTVERGDGIWRVIRDEPVPLAEASRDRNGNVSRRELPASKPVSVTHHPITRLEFRCHYSPGPRGTVRLTVASPP